MLSGKDFIGLYSLLTKIRDTDCTKLSPSEVGKMQADAICALIALDICVVPKLGKVDLVNEIPVGKQSPYVDGPSGNDGVSV